MTPPPNLERNDRLWKNRPSVEVWWVPHMEIRLNMRGAASVQQGWMKT